jgi:hypothetical protein
LLYPRPCAKDYASVELEAEEHDGQYQRPHPTWVHKPLLYQSLFTFVRQNVLVTTARRMKGYAVQNFTPQTCSKLCKNVAESAKRKCKREVGAIRSDGSLS